jgi:peptidoglycan/LPS O-acetylase OafA/YrhL
MRDPAHRGDVPPGTAKPVRRFEALDALRGIAAVAVVLLHVGKDKIDIDFAKGAHVAVDFFFVLSGFVLAHAYEGVLGRTLSFRDFMLKRLIRLYPLFLLGVAMGGALMFAKLVMTPEKVDPLAPLALGMALNMLMIPVLFGGPTTHGELFPGNGALWSTFFEIVANLGWGALGARARTGLLLGLSAAGGLALVFYAWRYHTTNVGFDKETFGGGLARVLFGFPLGIVLHRTRDRLSLPRIPGGNWLLAIVFAAILVAPHGSGPVPWVDLALVLFVLPALVLIGAEQAPLGRFGSELGRLSYPVYAIHTPILLAVSGLRQLHAFDPGGHWLMLTSLFAVMATAYGVVVFYDEPVRRALSASLARRRTQRRGVLT